MEGTTLALEHTMRRSTAVSLTAGCCLFVLLAGLIGLPFACPAGSAKKNQEKQKPRHTNRLAQATSPYLLMHAHNPVDWYPWGPEAFAKAKKEGKLIFLSIGYSSCYWCHVMARESFENEEVAALLNKWFVCIKVDREERPDIDTVYMTALNVMGQNGGWPLSMFMTADAKPILGGTYWPREDKVIEGKTYRGFKSIIQLIHKTVAEKPADVAKLVESVADATTRELEAVGKGKALVELDRKLVEGAVDGLQERFDKVYGGFGSPLRQFRGPKFPTVTNLELLLHEGRRTKNKEVLGMVTLTLDRMAQGGIYDQLGGGFHRYSTERTWIVPHFEKMLYDNGQLTEVYARAYRLTKNPAYRRVLRETLDYVLREMTSPEGALYSSQDAETDEEEGRFYVWTAKELQEALPNPNDLDLIQKVYGAAEKPNFEGKYYILHLPQPLATAAQKLGMPPDQLLARLDPPRRQLFQLRSRRPRPFLNKVSLTGWSGLMIAGFAEGGKVLAEPKYLDAARKAADFVLKHQKTPEGRLLRTYGAAPGQAPKAAVPAYLEDYAFLVHGLLNLYDATGEKKWLDEASRLTDVMIRFHGDKKAGGYYFTANDHEKLFARSKDQYDGATPSGNSVAAQNLVRLWIATGDKRYQEEAKRTFETFAASLKALPESLTTMILALDMYLDHKEAHGAGKKEKN
jgi:uncharacterized protein YyaL (SSP411 family)